MIEMVYPYALCLLPLPWFFRKILPKSKITAQASMKIPFYQNINQKVVEAPRRFLASGGFSLILVLLIWLLVVLSGTGLRWLGSPIPLPQTGRDIMLAIDLSGSMRTQDMVYQDKHESRLQIVKKVANEFISHRKGDRFGLILFGSRAYLQTPLTFDRKTVAYMLNDASIGIAGIQTAIGDGMGLALKNLIKTPKGSRALILMTDGGNNSGVSDPIDMAYLAKKAKVKIYTIGLGADSMIIQTMMGPQRVQTSGDLDIKTLKQIAKITGGQYFRATDGDALVKIYQAINKLQPSLSKKAMFRPVTPIYPWILSLALLLMMLLLILRLGLFQNRAQL
jgi:Ca-activated chloride channel homolog